MKYSAAENYGYDITVIYKKLTSVKDASAGTVAARDFFRSNLLTAFQNKMNGNTAKKSAVTVCGKFNG